MFSQRPLGHLGIIENQGDGLLERLATLMVVILHLLAGDNADNLVHGFLHILGWSRKGQVRA